MSHLCRVHAGLVCLVNPCHTCVVCVQALCVWLIHVTPVSCACRPCATGWWAWVEHLLRFPTVPWLTSAHRWCHITSGEQSFPVLPKPWESWWVEYVNTFNLGFVVVVVLFFFFGPFVLETSVPWHVFFSVLFVYVSVPLSSSVWPSDFW